MKTVLVMLAMLVGAPSYAQSDTGSYSCMTESDVNYDRGVGYFFTWTKNASSPTGQFGMSAVTTYSFGGTFVSQSEGSATYSGQGYARGGHSVFSVTFEVDNKIIEGEDEGDIILTIGEDSVSYHCTRT